MSGGQNLFQYKKKFEIVKNFCLFIFKFEMFYLHNASPGNRLKSLGDEFFFNMKQMALRSFI